MGDSMSLLAGLTVPSGTGSTSKQPDKRTTNVGNRGVTHLVASRVWSDSHLAREARVEIAPTRGSARGRRDRSESKQRLWIRAVDDDLPAGADPPGGARRRRRALAHLVRRDRLAVGIDLRAAHLRCIDRGIRHGA